MHSSRRGLQPHTSLWGGHGDDTQAHMPLAWEQWDEGMAPRYLPEFLLQQEPIPGTRKHHVLAGRNGENKLHTLFLGSFDERPHAGWGQSRRGAVSAGRQGMERHKG